MVLENVTGTLLAYKELEPGTFQHSDQLTTERRTNHGLRNQAFYTADGELYTVRRNNNLWAVTRLPQNLVLSDLDEAYRQLTRRSTYQSNYLPSPEKAKQALSHEDTVIVEHEGLELERSGDKYGYFMLDPKQVKKLNSEQRRAAQRIFGPDSDSFDQNMEMFARAQKILHVFVLMPEYVRRVLKKSGQRFLMQASSLSYFRNSSNFYANEDYIYDLCALRGIRKITEASRKEVTNGAEQSDLSGALKNGVPPAPQETGLESSGVVTLERMLKTSS